MISLNLSRLWIASSIVCSSLLYGCATSPAVSKCPEIPTPPAAMMQPPEVTDFLGTYLKILQPESLSPPSSKPPSSSPAKRTSAN
jgi:hypothetical protein